MADQGSERARSIVIEKQFGLFRVQMEGMFHNPLGLCQPYLRMLPAI